MDESPPMPTLSPPLAPPTSYEPPAPAGPGRAWGFWTTLGWLIVAAAAVLILSVLAGIVLGIAMVMVSAARGTTFDESSIERYMGLFISIGGCASMAVAVAVLAVPVWLRRRRFAEYMGLRSFSLRDGSIAMLAITALVVTETAIAYLLDRPMPESMIELREGALFLPLLWLYVVIAAPLGEEIIFRGFVYRGIAESRAGFVVATALWSLRRRRHRRRHRRQAGVVVAIALSSLLWMALHVQYGVWGLTWIFVLGLLLGTVRHITGSTTLCVVLHLLNNAFSMAALELTWSGA